jgi:aspartate racemase
MVSLAPLGRRQQSTPGILGGLGPLAHIQFEQHLINQSVKRGARCDQDHPTWILVNASNIPDRTRSLQGKAPDCTPWLVRYGQLLAQGGADFLVVPCHTAHAFYDRVQAQIDIPWISLMTCTSQFIRQHYPAMHRIGLLTTDGTLQHRLFSRSLTAARLQEISPTLGSPTQQQVMQAIYHPEWGIKATGTRVSCHALTTLAEAVQWLANQGAEGVVAGCTELSVGLDKLEPLPLPWVDPLEAVADTTLDLAFGVRTISSLLEA